MKKFTALFLVFSLMMFSVNLYAKERRGAKLIITKKDGQQIQGELITVKPNSLLLLNTEGKDVSIDIVDIKVITIVKKLKFGTGASIGGAIAFVSATLIAIASGPPVEDDELTIAWVALSFLIGAVASVGGMLVGGATEAVIFGKDKSIELEGMTDSEIREALDKLGKKARIRDYK